MNKAIIAFLMLLISSIVSAQTVEQFNINPTKSAVKWSGKKIVGGLTEGTILIDKGILNFNKQKLVGGEVVMNTKSISSEKASSRLIDHLKNEDFFYVDKYPTATFVITNVSGNLMRGKMTIKGITQEISFPVDVTYNKDAVVAKAISIKIDRTKFDVKYKSGNFFSSLGDGAIDDDFVLHITLIAEKSK